MLAQTLSELFAPIARTHSASPLMHPASLFSGGDFFPTTTRKVGGLITKSHTYATKFLLHPLLLDMADRALLVRNPLWLENGQRRWCTSKPQVNVSPMLEIHPGGKKQALHRGAPHAKPHRLRADTLTGLACR